MQPHFCMTRISGFARPGADMYGRGHHRGGSYCAQPHQRRLWGIRHYHPQNRAADMRSDPIPSLPRDLGTARRGAPGYPIGSARRRAASIGERVRAELEMEGDRHRTLAAFLQPRRPVAARRPYPASLPSGIRVVDAAVNARGIEAQRVGTRSTTHFPFTSANSASFRCRSRSARRCRARAYCADRPRCNSSPRRCCRRCRQTPARILVEGPALRAVIAGGFGPVSGSLHLRGRSCRDGRCRATPTHPWLSMSAPRGAKPSSGPSWISASAVAGEFGPGSSRATALSLRTRRPYPTPNRRLGSA